MGQPNVYRVIYHERTAEHDASIGFKFQELETGREFGTYQVLKANHTVAEVVHLLNEFIPDVLSRAERYRLRDGVPQ